MPQLLSSRADKLEALDEIERIVERHVAVGLTPETAAQLRQHMASLRADPRDLRVECVFETIPELFATRIHLSLSFVGGPSMIPANRRDH